MNVKKSARRKLFSSMVVLHTLYGVTFQSEHPDLLEEMPNFAQTAEVEFFDSASGTVRLRFVSTASREIVIKLCDDFKKEYELRNSARLTYKITITA